jgi:excisionase family DNA binding protein
MPVTIAVTLNGVSVPLVLDDEALTALSAAVPAESPASLYLTIPEAAELLRSKRQRVDDLLSAGKLTRRKDGARTLIERAELLAYLNGGGR